jgi:protein SCO1/2
MRGCRDQGERDGGGADQGAHAAKGTLGQVNPRLLLAAFLAGLFAIAAVALAISESREDPPDVAQREFAGARLPPDVRAPAFELTDERGDPVAMSDFAGRPVIVTFLYTNCDETCPPAAQQVKGALNELGEDVPALAIAVDPPRDTPGSARAFLSEQRMLGRMRFVLGSRAELEPVWRGYAISPQTAESEHQARIVIVDGRGYQRVGFPVEQATPERIAHDVRLVADM